MENKKLGLYIHIPFCQSKCFYCNFYSEVKNLSDMNRYVDKLIVEMEFYKQKFSDYTVDSIFIGGGTPSILPIQLFEKIVNAIHKNFSIDNPEFTIECNPSVELDFLHYKNLGVNRISLGVQTLNDEVLKLIGRRHSGNQALLAIQTANKYFENVSVDLICGLPNDNLGNFKLSLDTVLQYTKHLSLYMLKVEKDTPLYNMVKNQSVEIDDDISVDMYDCAVEIMKKKGFNRYEISNFSLPGFECKHNLKYWTTKDYLGLGTSAHSKIGKHRFYNIESLDEYLSIDVDKLAMTEEILNFETSLNEEIILRTRLAIGLDISFIDKAYNINFKDMFKDNIERVKNYIDIDDKTIKIKDQFILLQNYILSKFF